MKGFFLTEKQIPEDIYVISAWDDCNQNTAPLGELKAPDYRERAGCKKGSTRSRLLSSLPTNPDEA
jgi:hypothetical protein